MRFGTLKIIHMGLKTLAKKRQTKEKKQPSCSISRGTKSNPVETSAVGDNNLDSRQRPDL